MAAELRRYDNVSGAPDPESYRPCPMGRKQLVLAANEFAKRCDKAAEAADDDEFVVPMVLVAHNCKDMPSRQFELSALGRSRFNHNKVSKLWYALTKEQDLFIIKYTTSDRSQDADRAAAIELACCLSNFAHQFGSPEGRVFRGSMDGKQVLASGTMVAPDAILKCIYPEQLPWQPCKQIRSPIIAELEFENRPPAALLLLLDTYLLQPVADYVLGIKVYKRCDGSHRGAQQQQLLAGTTNNKRPFAAIALLWRRGAAPPGGMASLVGVWSFGTCELSLESKLAFCKQRGNLQQVTLAQIVHSPVHTAATDMITIPNAHLLRGVVDANGDPVPIRDTDQDLTIDLAEIRGIIDQNLPR
jgi:hypothetical protein